MLLSSSVIRISSRENVGRGSVGEQLLRLSGVAAKAAEKFFSWCSLHPFPEQYKPCWQRDLVFAGAVTLVRGVMAFFHTDTNLLASLLSVEQT